MTMTSLLFLSKGLCEFAGRGRGGGKFVVACALKAVSVMRGKKRRGARVGGWWMVRLVDMCVRERER